MIDLHQVSKEFRTAEGIVHAVAEVSLTIESGEFVALQGKSGSGKSTLLSLVGGLSLPTEGRVVVSGQAISEMDARGRAQFRQSQIGYVFQMFHLLPYLNVFENVLLAAERRQAERARTLLVRFGLEDRLTHRPAQLSAGERQRAAMARALLNEPRILLADEPTGNLDRENAEELLSALREFHQQGGTILMVTHDDQAASSADRVVQLRAGEVVA